MLHSLSLSSLVYVLYFVVASPALLFNHVSFPDALDQSPTIMFVGSEFKYQKPLSSKFLLHNPFYIHCCFVLRVCPVAMVIYEGMDAV